MHELNSCLHLYCNTVFNRESSYEEKDVGEDEKGNKDIPIDSYTESGLNGISENANKGKGCEDTEWIGEQIVFEEIFQQKKDGYCKENN